MALPQKLVLLERLTSLLDRDLIRLVRSSFWVKVGPCPLKCDKKDLMHVFVLTFGGLLRAEEARDFYHIKVWLENSLRRGIFVNVGCLEKVWVSFKYETLPVFFFGYDCLGRGLKECDKVLEEERNHSEDEQPYSIALKVESNVWGNESFRLNSLVCKGVLQSSYVEVPMRSQIELLTGGCDKQWVVG